MSRSVETVGDQGQAGRGDQIVDARAGASGNRLSLGFALFLLVIGGGFAYLAISTEGFLTVQNFRAVLRTSALTGIVAVAMTPIMLSGNFVSLGFQQSAMAGMLAFIALVRIGWPPPAVIVVVIACLIALGILQAWLIIRGLNPVITTLAAGAIVFGIVALITGGGIVHVGENSVWWGSLVVFGIPIEVLVFLLFTTLATVLISRTLLGRQTLLVGASRETARITGISFARVTVSAFVVLSIGLGIAAALNGAAFGQGTIYSFDGLTFASIAAILVGGTAIQGGRGSPLNSAVGAVVVSVATNIMTLTGLGTGARLTMQGVIVVGVVVLLQVVRSRRENR